MAVKHILLGTILASTLVAGTARANITFIDHPGDLCGPAGLPGGCEENIQFEQQATVPNTTITGDTNRSGAPVNFTTIFTAGATSNGGNGTGQLIKADGIGQANIVTSDGVQLTSLQMTPGNNTAWTDVLINLDFGQGQANIFVTDNLGHNFDDPLNNGENFIGIVASAGEVITEIQVTQLNTSTGAFGWNDFKQPRVSGVCTLEGTTCTPIPTPEPGSLMLLAGGLLGLGLLRRQWLVMLGAIAAKR